VAQQSQSKNKSEEALLEEKQDLATLLTAP
jgi:hypothetical protein